MLNGAPFYHSITKNTIIAFARLFSDVLIQRRDNAGAIIQTIAVPIAYANKEKTLRRVDSDPTLDKHVRVSLPRMTFEITNYEYDSTRKINKLAQLVCNAADGSGRSQIYSPVPYNINLSLYVVTKAQEDGLQILEQIVPYFAPEYNLSLSMVPEMNIVQTVPVILHGVRVEDNYDGHYENEPRIVIHTLTFTMKTNFWGPVTNGKIIKHVTANIHDVATGNISDVYRADGTIPTSPIIGSWLENF